MKLTEIGLLLLIPTLNALGFVFWTQLVNTSWLLGCIMGLMTATLTTFTVVTFFDSKINFSLGILPYFILTSLCFFSVEIVKMKALSISQPQLLTYVGLLTPIMVVAFLSIMGYNTLNKFHIVGGSIALLGTAIVLYGGK